MSHTQHLQRQLPGERAGQGGQPVTAEAGDAAAVHLTSCPDWLQLPLVAAVVAAAVVVVDYVVDNRRYAFYVYYVNIYIMQQVNLHTLTHTQAGRA